MKKALPIKNIFLFFLLTIFFLTLLRLSTDAGLPGRGLDPSWKFILSWAQMHKLQFGYDIIFTYGPYNSLWTGIYNPYSDLYMVMIISSILFYICYACMFLLFYTEKTKFFSLIVLSIFCIFPYSARDSIFFAYISLYTICIMHITSQEKSIRHILYIILFTTGASLIMLSKGSYMFAMLPVCVLSIGYCLWQKKKEFALSIGLTLLCAIPLLWILAGQSLLSIPHFFLNLLPISSGYVDAMSKVGHSIDYVFYIAPYLGVLLVIFLSGLPRKDKIFLACCFAIIGFLVLRVSFTRHDGHIMIGFCFIFLYISSTGLCLEKKQQYILCILFIFYTILILLNYPQVILSRAPSLISENIQGIFSKISGHYKDKYNERIESLRLMTNLPVLPGTSDIYSFDQTDLLASGNIYNPRPIPQSYSVYTPELCRLNAEHITRKVGEKEPPDNIFFRVQSIDNKFPSMEDGMSWPALFDGYQATRFSPGKPGTLILQKNATDAPKGTMIPLLNKTVFLNETVVVPDSDEPLFIKCVLTTGVMGKLRGILHKHPLLEISFQLADGTSQTKRFIAGMAETGFFLSPYIENTADFMLLATNNLDKLKNKRIVSFTISQNRTKVPVGIWNNEYHIELFKYTHSRQAIDPNTLPSVLPFVDPQTIRQVSCIGSINALNYTQNHIQAHGWLVVSQDPPRLPDQIYMMAQAEQGTLLFNSFPEERQDVADIFKIPEFVQSGFTNSFSVPDGINQFSLGYRVGDQVFQCKNLQSNLDSDQ